MDEEAVKLILGAVRAPVILDGLSEGHKFALVPSGMNVVDISKMLGPTDNIAQHVDTLSVESFCAYVARFGTKDTVVFANEVNARFEAALDYHPSTISGVASSRGDAQHTVAYACPQSDQWRVWNNASGKLVSQEEFAHFIENNLRDIQEPPGADMLQVALHLQVHKSAQFESGIRLDNGQVQFRYVEQVKGTTGATKAGDMDIPAEFKLHLPVFIDGTRFTQGARFRYRMNEGKLYLGYELIRPLEVFTAAVKIVTAEIAKGTKNHPLFQGARK